MTNMIPEHPSGKSDLSKQFENELTAKEQFFCDLLMLDHSVYRKMIPARKARVGLMTLFDFYNSKLKVFIDTPKYFNRLEWGIKYHFLGTARAARKLAGHLEYPPLKTHELTVAAFFHDIAKIKYSNDFFIRKLSQPDQRILNHSIESFQLLVQYCDYFNYDILLGVLQHHEYFNGNGYPLGLKGTQIHEYARIISIVDSYCAMMESREFSAKKETVRDVLEEIESCKNSQFDPHIADIFIKSKPGKINKKR